MNHSEVVKRFESRQINRRTNDVSWKASNVFCEGDYLYSYGHHFILAKYLGKDAQGNDVFLKNGDKYSVTTSRHQADVSSLHGPTVSFRAIANVFASWNGKMSIDVSNIIDFEKANHTECRYVKTEKRYEKYNYHSHEWTPFAPKQGMFVPYTNQPDAENYTTGYWHVLAGTLLRNVDAQGDAHYFLCALDEGNYFCAELPEPCDTVSQAFDILKPIQVRDAEKREITVQRQGEWFFVQTGLTDDDIRGMISTPIAPMNKTEFKKWKSQIGTPKLENSNGSNFHICRHIAIDGETYATGQVKHVNRWGSLTKEHRTIKLGAEWWKVYKNTEIRSWVQTGDFD